ncbi:cell division protein FtsQ/DivIB [Chloroflexota bacterium]
MRISLGERDGKQRRRQQRSSPQGRRRRAKTFESSAVQPQIPSKAKSEPNARPDEQGGARPQAHGAPSGRRRIRGRLVLLRLLSAMFLIGLMGCIVYTSTARKFFVYDAQVLGSHYLSRDRIYEEAGIHEQNIFWIRPEVVVAQIGALNGIKSVRVRCGLPARVTIEVEERKPVVMWRADKDWWLDEEGVVLPYGGILTDTVFVVDSSERLLKEGDRVEPVGVVPSVLQLTTALPQVRIFNYQPDLGLSFDHATAQLPCPVYVGNSEDLSRKIQVLQALTEDLAARKIHPGYVDVRRASYPVYGKPGSGALNGGK